MKDDITFGDTMLVVGCSLLLVFFVGNVLGFCIVHDNDLNDHFSMYCEDNATPSNVYTQHGEWIVKCPVGEPVDNNVKVIGGRAVQDENHN